MENCLICDAVIVPPGNYCGNCGNDLTRANPREIFEFGKLSAIDNLQSLLFQRLKKFILPFGTLFLLLSYFGGNEWLRYAAEKAIEGELKINLAELSDNAQDSIDRLSNISGDTIGARLQYKFEANQSNLMLYEIQLMLDDIFSEREKIIKISESTKAQKKIAPNYPFDLEYEPKTPNSSRQKFENSRIVTIDLIRVNNDLMVAMLMGDNPKEVSTLSSSLAKNIEALKNIKSYTSASDIFDSIENSSNSIVKDIDLLKIIDKKTEGFLFDLFIEEFRKDAIESYNIQSLITRREHVNIRFSALKRYDAMNNEMEGTSVSVEFKNSINGFSAQLVNISALMSLKTMGPLVAGDGTKKSFSASDYGQLEVHMEQMQRYLKSYNANISNINGFKEFIDKYADFLNEIKKNIYSLSAEVRRQEIGLASKNGNSQPENSTLLWQLSSNLSAANQRMRRALSSYYSVRQ